MKSQLRQAVNEQVQAFFVTPQSIGMVGVRGNSEGGASQLEEDDIDKNELKNIISKIVDDVQDAATNRMKSGAGGKVDHTGKLTEAAKWYDSKKKPAVGDKVHIGHIKKGGAGVTGIVTKIKGDRVDIKDPKSKRTFYGSLKKTAIMEISGVDSLKPNDPHTPEDEAEKDAADDVMEADPKEKKGSPRGSPHIENVRFWDLPESSLKYIIADASDAVKRLPMARKASKWADEVNDAVTVLHWRKKKGITVEEGKDEKKKGKIRKRPWVSGLDPAGGIGEGKEMKVKDKEGFIVDTESKDAEECDRRTGGTWENKEVGSLAKSAKSKAIVAKMHKMVKDKLKLKSIEDVQPIKDGVAFIFGDTKEGRKFADYLKQQRALGKVVKMRGDRLMVSLYY